MLVKNRKNSNSNQEKSSDQKKKHSFSIDKEGINKATLNFLQEGKGFGIINPLTKQLYKKYVSIVQNKRCWIKKQVILIKTKAVRWQKVILSCLKCLFLSFVYIFDNIFDLLITCILDFNLYFKFILHVVDFVLYNQWLNAFKAD